MKSFALVVPTLNAGTSWKRWVNGVRRSIPACTEVHVIDSSSDDETAAFARTAGFTVTSIARKDFNHGGTRQKAVEELTEQEVIVYLTQDAFLVGNDAITDLVRAFEDPEVGAAYGRQLPHVDAGYIGAHARLFNYPGGGCIKALSDRKELGVKTAFISNSFAAYRRSALIQVGGFPSNTIMNEDTWVAAKMLLSGFKVAYCSEAQVYHSHDYSPAEEFKRYFDIGVFHSREPWLIDAFGKPEGEGMRYLRSELAYLNERARGLLLSAVLRTILKYAGYRLGRIERYMSLAIKRRLSMHKGYWEQISLPAKNLG